MSSPQIRHDSIYTGDAYDHVVRCKEADGSPRDLTGYTFRAMLREYPRAPGDPLATFAVSLNGLATAGELLLHLDADQTDPLRDLVDGAVADLELTSPTPGATPRTVMRLDLDVDPDTTR